MKCRFEIKLPVGHEIKRLAEKDMRELQVRVLRKELDDEDCKVLDALISHLCLLKRHETG